MEALERLLRRFAGRSHARWWIGERPDVRESRIARAIAATIAYPTAKADPFAAGLVRLDRRQAAHVLAVAGTTSLAYGEGSPRRSDVKDSALALDALREDAVFLGNGLWDGPSRSWNPLTSATFDAGLIGYDSRHAFIFWVEEED